MNALLERLSELRKAAFILQEKFLVELCGADDEGEDTELVRKFGFFLWEIDEAIRKEKGNK